jgi:phosphate transport system protein
LQLRADYHEALVTTRGELIQLGALVVDALHHAIKAFKDSDAALAGRIIADDQIEERRRRIEAACVELLWRQQPVASELRAVTAMHEIAIDLGIVMRHVNDIAKQAVKAASMETCPDTTSVLQVGEMTEALLKDALQSFDSRDADGASSMYVRADAIEECYTPIIEEIQSAMQTNPESVACGVAILLKLTALQRIAERAENIAWHTEEML